MTSPPESHQAQIAAALSSLWAPPQVLSVLTDLHTRALAEEPFVSSSSSSLSSTHAASLDKFVALDPDKCALVYLLARAARARVIVEAGTSFGVSTIYLALAVAQNNGGGGDGGGDGRVIATELEPHKAAAARENWRRAGDQVSGVVDLREGDILDTLARDVPEVDFLLLDIWCKLALPVVRLLKPRLRRGALVVADNTVVAAAGYAELMAYLGDAANGFRFTQAPYSGGLMVAVYDAKS